MNYVEWVHLSLVSLVVPVLNQAISFSWVFSSSALSSPAKKICFASSDAIKSIQIPYYRTVSINTTIALALAAAYLQTSGFLSQHVASLPQAFCDYRFRCVRHGGFILKEERIHTAEKAVCRTVLLLLRVAVLAI